MENRTNNKRSRGTRNSWVVTGVAALTLLCTQALTQQQIQTVSADTNPTTTVTTQQTPPAKVQAPATQSARPSNLEEIQKLSNNQKIDFIKGYAAGLNGDPNRKNTNVQYNAAYKQGQTYAGNKDGLAGQPINPKHASDEDYKAAYKIGIGTYNKKMSDRPRGYLDGLRGITALDPTNQDYMNGWNTGHDEYTKAVAQRLADEQRGRTDALDHKKVPEADKHNKDYIRGWNWGYQELTKKQAEVFRQRRVDRARGYLDGLHGNLAAIEDTQTSAYMIGWNQGDAEAAVNNKVAAQRRADKERGYQDGVKGHMATIEDTQNFGYMSGWNQGDHEADLQRRADKARGYLDGLNGKMASVEDSQNANYMRAWTQGDKEAAAIAKAELQRRADWARGYLDGLYGHKASAEDLKNYQYVAGYTQGQKDALKRPKPKTPEPQKGSTTEWATLTAATPINKPGKTPINKPGKRPTNTKVSAKKAAFPQTGESTNPELAGLGFLTAMGALFGLGAVSRRKRS